MGEGSDCTLLVGPEKVPLQAHKLMLASASPEFKSLVSEGSEATDTFYVPDAKPESFSALLNYINTGHVNIHSFELARDLYLDASKYKITGLTNICAEHLRWNLTLETCCGTYEAALAVQDKMLMRESEIVIKVHIDVLLRHPIFEKLHMDTVAMIFGFEDLKAAEMDLFNAVQRCIKAQGGRKRSISDTDELGLEVYTRKVRNVLQQIRFLTMPAEQFAQGVAMSGLLSRADALAILLNLTGVSTPMPAGFSCSKVMRGPLRVPPAPPLPSCATLRVQIPADTALSRSIVSLPTQVGEDSWVVRVMPVWKCSTASRFNNTGYFGVFLACTRKDKTPWSYNVQVELVLLAPEKPSKNITYSFTQVFSHLNVEWGHAKFANTNEVLNSKDVYLKDGHLTFEVRIIVGATGQNTQSKKK